MSRTLLAAAAASAALLILSACQQSTPEIVNAYDPQGEALSKAAPVHLPPAVTHARTYRCSDNSLFYVDFYNNNTATIRTRQDGPTTMLTAEGGAPPYRGGAYTVSGNAANTSINGKSCHT